MNTYRSALKIMALLGLAIWSLASSAFTPGGLFTATGPITVKFNPSLPAVTCTLTVQGVANTGGGAVLNSASISGGNPFCATMVVQGLPWTWQPTSITTVNVVNMSIKVSSATCGGGSTPPLATTWSNSSNSLSATSLPWGGCTLQSLTLVTTPPLTLP